MDLFSPTLVVLIITVLIGFAFAIVIGGVRRIQQEKNRQRALLEQYQEQPAATGTEDREWVPISTSDTQHRAHDKSVVLEDVVGISPASPTAQAPPRRSSGAPSTMLSLARFVMLVGALLASGVLLLVIFPGSWIELLSQRNTVEQSREPDEPLILESMGEERLNDQFRVYGSVRNATNHDITGPQVVVKIYGLDGELLDTTVAPLAVLRLQPNAVSEFSVRHLRKSTEISRFSVTFKYPNGEPLPHRDVRGVGKN